MAYSPRFLFFMLVSYAVYYSKACEYKTCDNKLDLNTCEQDYNDFHQTLTCPTNSVEASVFSIPNSKRQSMELRVHCSANSSSCYFVFLFSDNYERGDCRGGYEGSSTNFTRIHCLQMKCGESFEVLNLTAGSYCTLLYERSIECKGNHHCHGQNKHSKSTKLLSNEPDVSSVVVDYNSQYYVIVLLIILFVVLAVVILLAILVTRKLRQRIRQRFISPENRFPNLQSIPKKKISEVLETRKPVKVFILYSRDCEHHQDFVNKLATFFSQAKCLVSYNVWEMQQIATNKVGWINEKLGGDYKILLICSRKGYEKQQAWLRNKSSVQEQTTEDQLYLQAIATIMHRTEQAFDYTKLFILRPSFVPLECVPSDICPGRQYVLPHHMSTLLCHLHDVHTRSVDVDDNGVKQWGPYLSPSYETLLDSLYTMSLGNAECQGCATDVI